MWLVWQTVFVCVFLSVTAREETTTGKYDGHKLVRVTPHTDDELHLLHMLLRNDPEKIDFWNVPTNVRQPVNIRVSPDSIKTLLPELHERGLSYDVTIPDLQRLIDHQFQDDTTEEKLFFNMSRYNRLEKIMTWMEAFNENCGAICSLLTIGSSSEELPLKVFKLDNGDGQDKGVVWIDAGMHAREWVSPAAAIYLIQQLVDGYKSHNPVITKLLSSYTFYVMPVANPDGYMYTWTTDRLWRKTRSIYPGSECRGADPNRNWGFHWGERGSSNDPCLENFSGLHAFSEVETRAIAEFLLALKSPPTAFISTHSYGQVWLTPWGYTRQVPGNYQNLVSAAKYASEAVLEKYGTTYTVGSAARALYFASGTSADWALGSLGAEYAYTLEQRDGGRYGFLLPPNQILQAAKESELAITTLLKGILERTSRQ